VASRAGLAVVVVVGLAVALLGPALGGAPLDDPGEGQHAEIAREVLGGSWLALRLNGVRYFDKPPLLYWLTASSFKVFGFTEWAARLAPLLGALLGVAATALLGVRLLGPGGGLLAGAALLSCALFAAFARYVRPETLFVAGIQWGFLGLLWARAPGARASRGWAVLGGAALGLASLAKDPLGLLGPLAAVTLALALVRRLRPIGTWLPPLGLALLLVIGLGWYVLASLTQPSFLWYTVVDNHVLNVARLREFPDEDVPLSALEFLAAAGFGAFPWILAAAVAVGAMLRRRAWREAAEIPWVALALWTVGVLAVFTLSRFKLPHYGLPVYPAIALLAARAWRDAGPRPRALIVTHLVLFAVIGGVLLWAARGDGRQFTTAVFGISDVYSRKEAAWGQPSPYPPWSALQPLLARAGVVLLAGAAGLVVATAARSAPLAAAVVAVAMLALVPVVTAGLAATSAARAVRVMAGEIRARLQGRDVLVLEGPIENAGAVEFYSGHRPVLLDSTRSVLGIGSTFEDASATFWSPSRFTEAWASARPPYLLTTRAPAHSIVATLSPGSAELLFAHNGRWLYRHAPAPRAAERHP
jgi:4-amino-4-deoxy-L-arabinose transferase-like glycosyltransferase